MKQSLSPAMILGAIVGLIAIVGGVFLVATRSPAGSEEGKPSGAGIPPEVQKQIQQQMQSGGGGGGGRPVGAPGGPSMGAPGGLMAPPSASGMGGR
jgi:hypothetical protein